MGDADAERPRLGRDDRPRRVRPRDALGRPLPYGASGVEPVPEEPLPPEQALSLARRLVTQGRAFGAHEVLEACWKACPAEERELWQGLAQLCVALTHDARGNAVGRDRLLIRGAGHVAAHARRGGTDYGLDLDAVVARAQGWQGTPGITDLPGVADLLLPRR